MRLTACEKKIQLDFSISQTHRITEHEPGTHRLYTPISPQCSDPTDNSLDKRVNCVDYRGPLLPPPAPAGAQKGEEEIKLVSY